MLLPLAGEDFRLWMSYRFLTQIVEEVSIVVLLYNNDTSSLLEKGASPDARRSFSSKKSMSSSSSTVVPKWSICHLKTIWYFKSQTLNCTAFSHILFHHKFWTGWFVTSCFIINDWLHNIQWMYQPFQVGTVGCCSERHAVLNIKRGQHWTLEPSTRTVLLLKPANQEW